MAWLSECYKYNFDFDGKKIGFVHVVNEEKAMLTVDGGYCNVMFKSIEAIENFKVDPRVLKLEQKDGGKVLKLDGRPIYCFTHIEDALKCCERVIVFDDGHKTVIRNIGGPDDGCDEDDSDDEDDSLQFALRELR